MGISEVPETCRFKAYDYCNSTWRSVAAQASGEVIIARGETIITGGTVLAPNKSGGIVLGSGAIERVILTIPYQCCSGGAAVWGYSGEAQYGIWVGGRSGTGYEPIPGSGCIMSGHGMFVPAGEQKEIYVRDLKEIHVAGVGYSGTCGVSGVFGSGWFDGWPVTYVGEALVC